MPVYKVPVVKMDLKSCTSRLINLFDSLKKREYKPNIKKKKTYFIKAQNVAF